MKVFRIIGGEVTWTCKANSEEEAWESLAQVKRLPIYQLKKLFKLLNDDTRTKLDNGLIND